MISTKASLNNILSSEFGVRSSEFKKKEFRILHSAFCTANISNRSGQALLELAIFGMVAIAALGFLIRVGMQANYEQETRMAAFRRALAAAAADDAAGPDGVLGTADDIIGQDARATTFHLISNRQMPNPSDGQISMPRMRSEASAFVQWGDRLTFSYMVDNDPVGSKGYGHPDLGPKNADGRYEPIDEGQKTRQQIIVRADEAELSFRQDHFYGLAEVSEVGNAVIQKIPSRILVLESFTLNFEGLGKQEVKQTHELGSSTPIVSELTTNMTTVSWSTVNAPRTDAALLNGPDGIPGTDDDLHVMKTKGFDNIAGTPDDEFGILLKSKPATPTIKESW